MDNTHLTALVIVFKIIKYFKACNIGCSSCTGGTNGLCQTCFLGYILVGTYCCPLSAPNL